MWASAHRRRRSLAHLVRRDHEALRDSDTECLGGLHVDKDFEFGRPLHRQVARFLATQNSAGIDAGEKVRFSDTGAVTQKNTRRRKLAAVKNRRYLVADGDRSKFRALAQKKSIPGADYEPASFLRQAGDRLVEFFLGAGSHHLEFQPESARRILCVLDIHPHYRVGGGSV